jgi:hypothetical protein
MPEQTGTQHGVIDHEAIDVAHRAATRDALLEHARMGRSVAESRDGKIVTVSPAEIFARYGFDEDGRPVKDDDVDDPNAPPPDAMMEAQKEDWFALDQMYTDGKLDQYRGEFVFYANGTMFGHGRSLVDHSGPAEAKALAAGVAPERLVYYFVPSGE